MMQYEFLKQFPRRMKHVGLYVVLIQNSIQKLTWQKYGFTRTDEQMNLLFAVMLYLMEQSLREENCTMDDIGAYIDTLNTTYFMKRISYENCKALGDFIVNAIFSNEGTPMYFDGYHFEQKAYQTINISYVANRIVYVDDEVRRTSYHLTDDGYNLLLGTLEIENNMKLTIHEIIFKMHLEKQSYDRAVDEIKHIFNLLHIQLQKIREAMGKIRRNALNYSVADYKETLEENLDTISDTKQKFQNYRELVKARAKELLDEKINVRFLDEKEEENLNNLREIERYLTRTIDEHQKILNGHFDMKALYTKELEALSQISLIKRFPLRTELFDKVIAQPDSLLRLDYFLRPLFRQDADKIYNPNKALELKRQSSKKQEDDNTEVLDFDEEAWEAEQERLIKEKLLRFERSLVYLFGFAARKGTATLLELQKEIEKNAGDKEILIPNTDIFKEIMVELIRSRVIDLQVLRKERSEYISEKTDHFQLSEMLLSIAESDRCLANIRKIEIYRLEGDETVVFDHVPNLNGSAKRICCSNVRIRLIKEEEE